MTSHSEYMVSVDGKSAPSKVHSEYTEAVAEAQRLSMQPGNRGAVIRVLQVVGVLEPAHVWRSKPITGEQNRKPWDGPF